MKDDSLYSTEMLCSHPFSQLNLLFFSLFFTKVDALLLYFVLFHSSFFVLIYIFIKMPCINLTFIFSVNIFKTVVCLI